MEFPRPKINLKMEEVGRNEKASCRKVILTEVVIILSYKRKIILPKNDVRFFWDSIILDSRRSVADIFSHASSAKWNLSDLLFVLSAWHYPSHNQTGLCLIHASDHASESIYAVFKWIGDDEVYVDLFNEDPQLDGHVLLILPFGPL